MSGCIGCLDTRIFAYILSFEPSSSLLYVSHHFRDVIERKLYPLLNKRCRDFLTGIENVEAFFSIKVVRHILNVGKQNRVWRKYMKDTHTIIKASANKNGNSIVSAGSLDPVFLFSQIVQEDRDFIQFFEALSVFDGIPKVEEFLGSASQMRKWMQRNRHVFDNIYHLDVSNKNIRSIPKEISYFKNLVVLNFSNNEIASIPPEMAALSQISTLNLSHNRLSSLSKEIFSKLITLKKLFLHNNQFLVFPEAILSLPLLTVLNLAFNQISCISMEKEQLPDLKELDVSHNYLVDLPQSLIERSREVRMDLCGNWKLQGLKINVKCRPAQIVLSPL